MRIYFLLVIILHSSLSFAQRSINEDTVIIGYVFTSFVVDKAGKLTNIKVIKGIDEEHDKRAVEMLEKAPDWNPGKNSIGEPVPVGFVLPIKMVVEPQDIGKRKINLTDLHWAKDKIRWELFKDSLFDFSEIPLTVLCVIQEFKPDKHLQVKVINAVDTSQLSYPKIKRNDQALELFQMCFDLNEVYTRKLQKKIFKRSFVASLQSLSQLDMLEKSLNVERINEMYEMMEETEFGSNIKKMGKWRKKIAKELYKASKY